MMKGREALTKMNDSLQYRQMFREVIKTQIQTLIDQLASTGEESVLLTSCIAENDMSDNGAIGSKLGLEFVNQEDLMCMFREFCSKKLEEKIPSESSGITDKMTSKRKLEEINGEDANESSEAEQLTPFSAAKRSKSLTSSLNSSGGDDSLINETINSVTNIPKGYSKCSVCNYMSKFKANVTRHERGIHRINLEGAPLVTVQYSCAICDYKSTYRSNVMRHEKSVHKLNSTPAELESRKVPFLEMEGDFSSQGIFNEDTKAVVRHGDQMFVNQTGILGENMVDQSYVIPQQDVLLRKEQIQFDIEAGMKLSETEKGAEYDDSKSDTVPGANGFSDEQEGDEGCHICNHCQVVFKSLSELRTHIDTTHFISGNFTCEKCEKSFKTEISLQIHMSSHSASKQEVCGCGKAFQYRTSLIRHERKCGYWKNSHGNANQEDANINFSAQNNENVDTKHLNQSENDNTINGEEMQSEKSKS